MSQLGAVSVLAVVVAMAVSAVVLRRLDRPSGAWGARLRSRLVLGVPWGTLATSAFVLAVYLFVQGGWWSWHDPLVLPFRAWSYLYPLGMLTSAFAHNGAGHLVGNLSGTLILAPICEYAWGHFPRERGTQTFSSWRTNPWLRALVVVPAASIAVGLLTALFAWGPIVGFSGVVFAFAGLALVLRPMTALVATLGAGPLVDLAYRVLQKPVLEVTPSPSPPSPPWWAGIAIQGHALGLLVGVLVGIGVWSRRGDRPRAHRIWLAVLFFAVAKGLWAVYWYRGSTTYVLYRGLGLVLVVGLALLVASAVAASSRPTSLSVPGLGDLTRRQAATGVIVLALAVMAGIAVPTNLITVGDEAVPDPSDSVEVGGYYVTYAEHVPNRMVSVINVSAFGETTTVRTSGLIVVNPDRHIWTRTVSAGYIAYAGYATVDVGGLGWREKVFVTRQGWSAVGGGTAYHVWVRERGGSRVHAFNSSGVTAAPVVDNRTVSVVPTPPRGFALVVRHNATNATMGVQQIPDAGTTVTAGGLTLARAETTIYAVSDGTRVAVAEKETYRT